MRKIVLLVALALVLTSGLVATAAQTSNEAQTEEEEQGASSAGCATPMASPEATPAERILSTPVISMDASPTAIDECLTATPEMATPGT
jgi:hypothetical protein